MAGSLCISSRKRQKEFAIVTWDRKCVQDREAVQAVQAVQAGSTGRTGRKGRKYRKDVTLIHNRGRRRKSRRRSR